MNSWNYPGAKWWKFDFHTHTPASDDFLQGCQEEDKDKVTPEFWLRKFMEKKIDCIAVTDHNSGLWIDELKDCLKTISEDNPEWYHPLHLFPGVEISTNGGVHMLAVFDLQKKTSDIDSLLGAVGYQGTKGASDDVTTKSLTEVVDLIVEHDGIPIPAHVDGNKGLFEEARGTTLDQVLDSKNIYAMELCDDCYSKPRLYAEKQLHWAEVRGSDMHNFRTNRFGEFTWIKMDAPSIDGLKLALIDGIDSVNRKMQANPNQHAEFVIESIAVKDAKHIGRPDEVKLSFSPFLNTIIGGRGSGKSTLLEFMRFVLRREKELPQSLAAESEKYFQTRGEEALLTEESVLHLIYRKGDTRYRLNWSAQADCVSLEEQQDNAWIPVPGEIKSLFPAYIYSQKQIFELSKKPQALIDIIDSTPEVDFENIENKHQKLKNRYKQIEQKITESSEKIDQENMLKGQRNDLIRQIESIEKSGHREVLQRYHQRQQQLSVIESLEAWWRQMDEQLSGLQQNIAPAKIGDKPFEEHPEILKALQKANNMWMTISTQIGQLSNQSRNILSTWEQEKNTAVWMRNLKTDMGRYKQLQTQLNQQGIDPKTYPTLLQKKSEMEKALNLISSYQEEKKKLELERLEILQKVKSNRKQLSENRSDFLKNVLQDNSFVSISLIPFGQIWEDLEQELRKLLQCGDRFNRDMESFGRIYAEDTDSDSKAEKIKTEIENIRDDRERAEDRRFASHLQSLPRESISDLRLWFPEDNLKITYRNSGKKIEQGSPGQKTAALLSFILSYGEEPLLLDQPEDDLDNELIYSLIVTQLRELKPQRQVIVVTHNANIVVNGDAEMVFPLEVVRDQTRVFSEASIQNKPTREKICDILEGGRKAFEQRYRRIYLEH